MKENEGEADMDNRIKLLIGVGASVAANCQPCLKDTITMARADGVTDDEILWAIGVAKAIRKGAISKMDEFAICMLNDANNLNDPEKKCGCTKLSQKE